MKTSGVKTSWLQHFRAALACLLTIGLASAGAHAQAPSHSDSKTEEEIVTQQEKRIGPTNVEVPTPRSAHASAYDEDPKDSASISNTQRLQRRSQSDPEAAVEADEGVSVGQVREGTMRGATGLPDGSAGIDD